MFEIPEKSKDQPRTILDSGKEKNSGMYFLTRYIGIGSVLLLFVFAHWDIHNLESLDGGLEIWVLLIAMILVSLLMYKKVRGLTIDQILRVDQYGFRWPDNLTRFALSFIFSGIVSMIILWSVLNINIVFDNSQPKEVKGEVKSKHIGDIMFIFGTSYRLKIKPEIAGIKYVDFKVNEDLFSEINEGIKVALVIKGGALGYPYVSGVKPYKANGTIHDQDENQ